MGNLKKEKNRKIRENASSKSPNFSNVKVKGENFYRNAKKTKLLNMYKADAKVLQSKEIPVARVDPNRKWFNNTRVISQDALDHFREAISSKLNGENNSYNVLLKRNKLPLSLLNESGNSINFDPDSTARKDLMTNDIKSKNDPNNNSKKNLILSKKNSNLKFSDLNELINQTDGDNKSFQEKIEINQTLGLMNKYDDFENLSNEARDAIFSKGQSKRIWNELYKVIDSSDVVIQVLDARDPMGTRCKTVERYMKTETPHKHLIFVLNKCDLIPTWCAAAWVKHLSKDFPTLAFHASIKNSFGKGSLIQLLRQFSQLHSDRKQISIGFIGYPNVGKSSIINTLRNKKVCTVAPIPGETKVWQYITLTKRIFLIDCPGIVPPSLNDTEEDLLFRSVVRVENVSNPDQYIDGVLKRCKTTHLERTYEVKDWDNDSKIFMEKIGKKAGKLLKGGEVDFHGVAIKVINDFLRGKIPWFVPPPEDENSSANRKRKLEDRKSIEDDTKKQKTQPIQSPAETKVQTQSEGSQQSVVNTSEETEETEEKEEAEEAEDGEEWKGFDD
ncbi:putative GTPase NOG2 [Ascoidea rubescens DSM 1968]|uniref:Nucleolar GTP-binding protein 2 n=1 Tax=Ascoidea rubescens DSM 1968 TaxID=1344418 RepID=A0A1D2VNV6_9ASCO|nr:P-loop containing nucleoside triphosphate hydrolase protein [Ascoidea rubescens DSM 1968]ODV63290.1 P-loop containing nucleoside triphosphate hydrolase protein [Ascoidea rubescens DSM 1968]